VLPVYEQFGFLNLKKYLKTINVSECLLFSICRKTEKSFIITKKFRIPTDDVTAFRPNGKKRTINFHSKPLPHPLPCQVGLVTEITRPY
jgi:hypothetical protein